MPSSSGRKQQLEALGLGITIPANIAAVGLSDSEFKNLLLLVLSVIGVRSFVPGKYRIKADGTFQIWNNDQSKFHSIAITGLAGEETISIGPAES